MSDDAFKIEVELSTETATKEVKNLTGAVAVLKKEEVENAKAINKNNAGMKQLNSLFEKFSKLKKKVAGERDNSENNNDGNKQQKSGTAVKAFTFIKTIAKPLGVLIVLLGTIRAVLTKVLEYSKKQLEKSSSYYTARIDPVFAEALTRTLYASYQGDSREGIQEGITGVSRQITAARQGDSTALSNLTMLGTSLFNEKRMERQNHEVLRDILYGIMRLNNDDAKQHALRMFNLNDSSFARMVGVGQTASRDELSKQFNEAMSSQLYPSMRRLQAAENTVGIVERARNVELKLEDLKHRIAVIDTPMHQQEAVENFLKLEKQRQEKDSYSQLPWYLKPFMQFTPTGYNNMRQDFYAKSMQEQLRIMSPEQREAIGAKYDENAVRYDHPTDAEPLHNTKEIENYLLPTPKQFVSLRKDDKVKGEENNTNITTNNLDFTINITAAGGQRNAVMQGGQVIKENVEEIAKKVTHQLQTAKLY